MSMGSSDQQVLNTVPNSIQINGKLSEIVGHELSCIPVARVEFSSIYHHTRYNKTVAYTSENMPMFKFYVVISKAAVVSFS